MALLSALKTQIANDLHRSDSTTQIADAITAAIQYYERERWFFLEGRATMSTTNGTAWYAVPTDILSFDTMLITVSGAKEPLDYVHYQEIDELDSGLYTGIPTRWTYYADQIRLYPAPNSTYTVTISYHKKLATLTDSGSNAWTTEAKELIRFRAGWDVLMNHLKAVEMAKIAKGSELDAYRSLQTLNTMRLTTGRIRKTEW